MVNLQECRGTNILAIKSRMAGSQTYFDYIPQYRYENIKPDEWYPMEQFTLLVDYVENTMGPLVVKNIGQGIIPEMVQAGIIPKMPPKEFLKGLSKSYNAANRGPDIGDWKVIKEENNHIVIENTTMHNCKLEEGVILGAMSVFGGKKPRVLQKTCVKKGDKFCTFDIFWE